MPPPTGRRKLWAGLGDLGRGMGCRCAALGMRKSQGPWGSATVAPQGAAHGCRMPVSEPRSLLGVTSISHCEKVANFSGNRKNRLSKEARTPAPSSTVQRGETEVWLGLRTRPPGAPQKVVPTLGCPTPGQVGEWAERLPAFLPAFLPVYIAQGWGCGNLGRSDLCPA